MKEIKPKLKALSIYQIAGGVIGLGLTGWIFTEYIDSMTGLLLTLFVIAIILYVYSVYCGILLPKNHTPSPALVSVKDERPWCVSTHHLRRCVETHTEAFLLTDTYHGNGGNGEEWIGTITIEMAKNKYLKTNAHFS